MAAQVEPMATQVIVALVEPVVTFVGLIVAQVIVALVEPVITFVGLIVVQAKPIAA